MLQSDETWRSGVSLRPIRHPLQVRTLAGRTAGAFPCGREWLIVTRPDRLERQHAGTTAVHAPKSHALNAQRAQMPHGRWWKGFRGLSGAQHASAMAQRDHPALPFFCGRLVGRNGHRGMARHRQGLVDLVAILDLDLERVFDLAAHRARRTPFTLCSQCASLDLRSRARLRSNNASTTIGQAAPEARDPVSLSKARTCLHAQPLSRRGTNSRHAQQRRGYVDRRALFITCRSRLTPLSGRGGVRVLIELRRIPILGSSASALGHLSLWQNAAILRDPWTGFSTVSLAVWRPGKPHNLSPLPKPVPSAGGLKSPDSRGASCSDSKGFGRETIANCRGSTAHSTSIRDIDSIFQCRLSLCPDSIIRLAGGLVVSAERGRLKRSVVRQRQRLTTRHERVMSR